MKTFVNTLVFLLLAYSITCGQNNEMNIIGKTYSIGDSSLVIRSLTFVNDSICHYKHQFFIDIDSAYRECLIVCKYKTDENKIIISSQEYPAYLDKSLQVGIPNYWSTIERYFKADSVKLYEKYSGCSQKDFLDILSLVEIKYLVNGYIDNPIADTLFLLNNCIIYNKYIEIKSYFEEWGFLAFYQKFVFVDRNIYVSLKQKRLILTSKEANSIVNGWPINNEEEFSSFLWSMRKMIPEYNSKTTDNDIVNKHYRNLRKIFRKLKIAPKEQEDYIYDCYLFDTMAN